MEMNMHSPQNVLAETELRHLAAIPWQIVSPANNSPIIGIFQDSMLGSYRFTRDTVAFTQRDAMNLLMMYKNVNVKKLLEKGEKITSFDILSQILPPLTMKYKTKLYEDSESAEYNKNNFLEIRNGEYVRGQMDKGVLGGGTKGILHRICNDYGNMAVSDFIDNLQNVITEYMKTSSFSVGVSDLISDRKTSEKIIQTITDQKMEVQSLIEQLHLGTFKNETASSNRAEFELRVTNLLNKATDKAGKIGRTSLSKTNRFVMIVNSGSKGSPINISQMISCVGQQSPEGKRIPYGFDSRTLPHYSKFDDSPGARGFVENSYISGLTAPELFFHAMGGRIGLIDTAVKSVSWETPIVLLDNGKPIYTEIGRWIDNIIDSSNDVKKYEEKNMELVNINSNTVYVPTMNEHGVVTWEEITAVTRHDPGNVLYKIKSLGGRSVIVTESKSLLIWNKEKQLFNEVLTPEIKVGDCLPVTETLCDSPITSQVYIVEDVKILVENIIKCETNVIPDDFIINIINCKNLTDYIKEKLIESEWFTTYSEKDRDLIGMAFSRMGDFCEYNNLQLKINNKFDTHNNVVLDPIVEITPLSPEDYPKMYDLTIPTTLNFGLANGLQVRDTSQTGYIQRRLIKGLEDLKVEYDMTVRNSKGKIIQFQYGDDGFDSTKVESQSIPLTEMSIEDIYMHYDILGLNDYDNDLLHIYSSGTVSRMKKQRLESKSKCFKYINLMIDNRDKIVEQIFHQKNENGIKIPVAFQSIINNIQGQLNLNSNSIVDITPLEAFELIEEYYNKLLKITFNPPTKLFEIMYFFYLTPRELLTNKRFHRKGLLLLLETIVLKYKQAIVHPGEMVGVIAGQSIGEPTTQLTLNSFVYETEIPVRNSKGEIKCVQIGDFTKWGIETSRKIDYMSEKDTTYAELSEFYEVPSVTEEGQTVWKRIEAVTKHPVINEDGSNTMLKVTTRGNREIIATKAKSFVQLIDGKIQGTNGSDLNIGDYLPVSKKALDYTESHVLDMRRLLPPSEYIYGTEMEKARSVMNEHRWWLKHSGKTFTLPYSRSDSAYCALNGGDKKKNTVTRVEYKSGYVYTMTNSICNYQIPEYMPLDYDFGYLIGAYCAEGCMTKHQVSIANNDLEFMIPIERWCAKHNLTTKIYCHKDKIQEGWTSQDIRIYSSVLCHILEKLCGKLSHNKFVSDIIMFSNRECILGFLDAYISGDGSVTLNKDKVTDISIYSVSYKLLMNTQVMLKNLGVLSKIHKATKQETNNRGSQNIKQGYYIRISNKQSQLLASMLNLTIESKRNRIKQLLNETFLYDYCRNDLIIPNKVQDEIIFENRDGRCIDMEFDQIISIEEVSNTTSYAYDLTVEGTRTFDCINGLAIFDTFHLAGVASKSNVTRGVPRIEEILRLTKNPKNPSLTVHLKPVDEGDQEKAQKFANMIEHTKLIDVVKSVQICFDPVERKTAIEEDRLLLEQFYEFEDMINECLDTPMAYTQQPQKSKWIIRMEFDTEILLDKNITTDDIHFAIKNSSYGGDISCVYSDYNMDKLVFRIRTTSSLFSKNKKKSGASPLDQSDDIYYLKNFQDTLLNSIVLRGIYGITNVLPRKLQNMVVKDGKAEKTKDGRLIKEDGKYVKKDVWILDTNGSNLLDVLSLDFIDSNRTFSNDIKEVFDVLGIEAARETIYNEFVDVMEFSDVYINYHHLSLLADRMTCNEDMVSIFRSGILNDDIGPISKSTFEVHTEVLLNASRHGEFDHMRGVSAAVMLGQYGYFGTNAFNVVLDLKEMENLDSVEMVTEDKNEEIEKMFDLTKNAEEKGQCSKSDIEIKNNIKHIKIENTEKCEDDYDIGF